ncbi:hypothetical protein ASD8599_01774 [Ascidiaceihabitans donghaensis]|uniref:Uncharacterized protein n=1 Tax=Ascidiaceihabitans donghaensis TaxID=1510460 RepID=A0A2R8BDB1_9RHOB|nr:hypothetical protein [Ascidiaceihabitans donghaensis]SPH21033.1 hypothetical protein ASD8599_01774 [Ascidiaceihabitans donghaensis]
MIAEIAYPIALVGSLLWFAAAFRYFSFQHYAAAKVFVPRSARTSPIFPTIAVLTRFLGGMNAAFALLSLVLLMIWFADLDLFKRPSERGVLLIVLSAAHFSQFIFNVPILRNGERRGESFWNVLSGPMLFIFVIDAVETLLNGIAGILQFLGA